VTETGADGKLMLILCCRNLEREREKEREGGGFRKIHLGTTKRIQTIFVPGRESS